MIPAPFADSIILLAYKSPWTVILPTVSILPVSEFRTKVWFVSWIVWNKYPTGDVLLISTSFKLTISLKVIALSTVSWASALRDKVLPVIALA